MSQIPSLLLCAALAAMLGPNAFGGESSPTAYRAEDGAIVQRNGQRFCNRPLYCPNSMGFVMAGDRPFARLINNNYFGGSLMVAVVRGGKGKWLHQCADVAARYRADRMEWIVTDPMFAGMSASFTVVPLAEGVGLGACVKISGAKPGDRLVWAYGAVMPEDSLANCLDPVVDTNSAGLNSRAGKIGSRGFSPGDCKGNSVTVEDRRFSIMPLPSKRCTVVGYCSVGGPKTADAVAWEDPVALAAGTGKDMPIAAGVVSLDKNPEVYWAVQAFDGDRPGNTTKIQDAKAAFAAGVARADSIANRVTVHTPDPEFDAAVSAAGAAVDGVYRGGIFTHGGMAWSVPYLGWRTLFGGIAYGWHDRVQTEAKIYIDSQVTKSDKRLPKSDPSKGYSHEAFESRFFGRGWISTGQSTLYNMQSQFFDQLVREWRWTGDAKFEKLLRPALELHLERAKECFDPDDDGVYESYINVWPTDSQWYNGGGSAEETAYVYYGHKAALEMARRSGDAEAMKRHQIQIEKIKSGFFKSLWIPRLGYVGAYREQGGHQRLHEDSWLYSIFLPIDAGLLSVEQAAQALHYTEWGLERQKMPFGGERVWTSNWVPSAWSVREMYPGDCWSVALAYCQAGLPDDAWKVFQGTYLECMYHGPAPGGLASANSGTDFCDVSSMFCRAVVEGMFGYAPDYPNGVVRIAPQLPSHWDHAQIATPDVRLDYRRKPKTISLCVELQREAAMLISLPVRTKKVVGVKVNGKALTSWRLEAGFGRSLLNIELPFGRNADIVVQCAESLPQSLPVELAGNVGESVELRVPQGRLGKIDDPQQALTDVQLRDGVLVAKLAKNPGHHLAIGLADVGGVAQRQLFKIHIADPLAEAAREAKQVEEVPKEAKWECIDLNATMNGDVRMIYRQKYLSPRPNTCSVRIGSDGYSPWTFVYWGISAPEIDLTNVPKLLSAGRVVTPQGVPFAWHKEDRNIGFTSLWDNWPKQLTVPVKKRGEAIWFLVCGSTNPMQCRIANAELRMNYADGVVERVELIPPLNYWSLCPLGPGRREGADYNYQRDSFCLPKTPPAVVQLGKNCRAMLLNQRLRPNVELESVTLETLSQEVVVGLMGVTVMNPVVQ